MLRKEQNTAQRAKNIAVILPSGEEKPQSANVGMLGETFYVSSTPSEHNKKTVNEQWQNEGRPGSRKPFHNREQDLSVRA